LATNFPIKGVGASRFLCTLLATYRASAVCPNDGDLGTTWRLYTHHADRKLLDLMREQPLCTEAERPLPYIRVAAAALLEGVRRSHPSIRRSEMFQQGSWEERHLPEYLS
jgi:hypothetical protein